MLTSQIKKLDKELRSLSNQSNKKNNQNSHSFLFSWRGILYYAGGLTAGFLVSRFLYTRSRANNRRMQIKENNNNSTFYYLADAIKKYGTKFLVKKSVDILEYYLSNKK